MFTEYNQIPEKRKICTVLKWRPKRIFFLHHFDFWQKMGKNFLKGIWLKIEDHEYINIAKLKIEKFLILFQCDFRGRTFLLPPPPMLIYVNQCENNVADLMFSTKRSATTI